MQKLGITTLKGLIVVSISFGVAVAAENHVAHIDSSESRPVCTSIAGATATSRDFDWDGSDNLGVSVGGHASYIRGSDDKVHASGDPQLLAHLTIREGDIKLDCTGGDFETGNLVITLPGREFKSFGIAGSGDLSLRKLDQPTLKLAIAGSASIKAAGRVDEVNINMAGSGNADLRRVTMQVTKVRMTGGGSADIAPHAEADIHIVGPGNVNLYAHPGRLETHIVGPGGVHNIESGG